MKKNHCNQNKSKIVEKIKWLYIFIILIISFLINYYFYKTQLFIRIFSITFFIICTAGVFLYTKKGKFILSYIMMSQKEMKKIVWPPYKETLYTTFVVIAVTILMSLLLWSLDSIIFRLISFIISLRF